MCASIWIFWRVYCLHEWLKLVATHPDCCKSFSTECACHSLEFNFLFMSSIPPWGWDLLGDLVFNLKILVQPGARGRTMYKEAVAIDQDSKPWFHNGEIRPAKNEKMQPPAAVILSPDWRETLQDTVLFACFCHQILGLRKGCGSLSIQHCAIFVLRRI